MFERLPSLRAFERLILVYLPVLIDIFTVALLVIGCFLTWLSLRSERATSVENPVSDTFSPAEEVKAPMALKYEPNLIKWDATEQAFNSDNLYCRSLSDADTARDHEPNSVERAVTERAFGSVNPYARSVSVAVAKSRKS